MTHKGPQERTYKRAVEYINKVIGGQQLTPGDMAFGSRQRRASVEFQLAEEWARAVARTADLVEELDDTTQRNLWAKVMGQSLMLILQWRDRNE